MQLLVRSCEHCCSQVGLNRLFSEEGLLTPVPGLTTVALLLDIPNAQERSHFTSTRQEQGLCID